MATWTWTPWTSPPSSANYGVLCFAGDATGQYIIAGNGLNTGQGDNICYTNNSGVTWNATTSSSYGISGNVISVASSADGRKMYAVVSGGIGFVSISTDYGATWSSNEGINQPYSLADSQFYTGICCTSNGNTVVMTTNSSLGGTGRTYLNTSPFSGDWTTGNISRNFTSIAVNPTGTFYVATSNPGLYISTDGIAWTLNTHTDNNQTWTSVKCSLDGSTFVACTSGTGGNTSGNVYYVIGDPRSAWTRIVGNLLPYINVAVNNTGTRFYACTNNGLYYGNSLGLTLDTTTTSIGNVTSVYLYPTGIHNGLPLALSVYGGSGTVYGLRTASYFSPTPICFKEGSKILCLIDGVEKYIPIESMIPSTLVKTSLNGYKSVAVIGFSKVYNPGNGTKSIHHLVKCTPANYPELTEDLMLTGAHSILVDNITDTQRADLIELAGRIFITDDKYRLMACLDDRSEPYDIEGLFTIWHFALENTQYTWNYGVYANGLLVETTSLRMIKEFSGMTLLS